MPLFSQVLQYKTKKLHSCNNSLNICPQMTATTLLGGSSSLLRTQAPVRGQKKNQVEPINDISERCRSLRNEQRIAYLGDNSKFDFEMNFNYFGQESHGPLNKP